MVSHRDVLPYLVAIKTFANYAAPSRIAVLCDPTVGDNDRATLKAHIQHVEFIDLKSFRHPRIPVGGCWERLFAVTELAKNGYVVQLDSDTITTGEVSDAVDAVIAQAAFVMGKEPNQTIQSLAALQEQTAHQANRLNEMHVHGVVEHFLPRVGFDLSLKYTDGWASFTGFPRDVGLQERMFDFAGRMRHAIGSRLDEWGSEMVCSNFLVSNASDCSVLPFPKYCTPTQRETAAHLWHFVGSMRYDDFRYTSASVVGLRRLHERVER